jgi:cytochrome c553
MHLISAAAVLALAGLLFGASARSQSAQSLEERLPACWACHGENGQSQQADVPSLGGQPQLYMLIQLVMFRDKLRVISPMNEMTLGLQDTELRKAADLIAALPPPAPVVDGDPARMARARELAQKNRCDFCHQSDFAGHNNVPRLAGQREDYLIKALQGYKDNSRYAYDAQMADVVYPLQDRDFIELAYFLARVK